MIQSAILFQYRSSLDAVKSSKRPILPRTYPIVERQRTVRRKLSENGLDCSFSAFQMVQGDRFLLFRSR